jgi:hypothetical protein
MRLQLVNFEQPFSTQPQSKHSAQKGDLFLESFSVLRNGKSAFLPGKN